MDADFEAFRSTRSNITTRFCLRHIPKVNFQAGMSYADARLLVGASPAEAGRPLEVSKQV